MLSYLLLLVILVVLLLGLNLLLSEHAPDLEKLSPYECGYNPVYGQTRSPFTISFYLVGLLFLAFDLEVALLYPLVSNLAIVGSYGYWLACLFLTILTVGFVYELGAGVLHFTDQRSSV